MNIKINNIINSLDPPPNGTWKVNYNMCVCVCVCVCVSKVIIVIKMNY